MDKTLTRDEFSQIVSHELKRIGLSKKIIYDREAFALRWDTDAGTTSVFNLHNAYHEYCNAPDGDPRVRALRKFTEGALESPHLECATFDQARPLILPAVKDASYLWATVQPVLDRHGATNPTFDAADSLPVHNRFSGCRRIQLLYVIDGPSVRRHISRGMLKTWGVDLDTVHATAFENLRQLPPPAIRRLPRQTYQITGDMNVGPRLLDPDFMRQFKVHGDPVALLPDSVSVFLGGSDDHDSLQIIAEMGSMAMDRSSSDRCGYPIRRSGKQWVDYNPSSVGLRSLKDKWNADLYDMQQQVLGEKEGRVFTDLKVARRREAAETRTVAIWPDQSGVLLPAGDYVLVLRPSDRQYLVPWDVCLRIAGPVLKRTDHIPERYEALRRLNDEEFEKLASANVGSSPAQ